MAKFHLPRFHIGTLTGPPPSPMLLEYRQMARDFETSELFQTRPSFYFTRALLIVTLFALAVAGVTMTSSTMVHLASGVLLGFFWQQCAFVGHDTGHMSITRSRPVDNLIGLVVGNMCTGIGISWWKVRGSCQGLVVCDNTSCLCSGSNGESHRTLHVAE